MGFFSARREAKENRERLFRLHGLVIRYVTTRDTGEETVLGHAGNVSLSGDEVIVLASGETVFRSKIDDTRASYLMSGDGAVLTAHNLERGGEPMTVTVHFVDYIK